VTRTLNCATLARIRRWSAVRRAPQSNTQETQTFGLLSTYVAITGCCSNERLTWTETRTSSNHFCVVNVRSEVGRWHVASWSETMTFSSSGTRRCGSGALKD